MRLGWLAVGCLCSLLVVTKNLLGAERESAMEEGKIYAFTMKTIDGQDKLLSDYRGKALLIVNTASQCGFTPQYAPLEKLYGEYKDRGFEILAFPANNFMGQEPGTNGQIKQFCEVNFHTTFPLFSKISVKGNDIHPLYKYLTSASGFNGPITWNFNKFLVGPEGTVVARFGSRTDPLDPTLVKKLKEILPIEKIEIFNAKTGQVEKVDPVMKSDVEWKKILTPEQYEVTRKKGTERPFSKQCAVPPSGKGTYQCIGCGTDLFAYGEKFESGTGWPSFWNPVSPLNVRVEEDNAHGMRRLEILCARCGAHLGHVFDDGPPPTGKRYCINSVALKLASN